MFSKCVGAANLKFSLEYESAIRELNKQIGSIVVKCAADGVLHSSRTDALVYEACANVASRLSEQKLAFDLEALSKAGKSISQYLDWLENRQKELLLQDFSGFIEGLVKGKAHLANVRGMVSSSYTGFYLALSPKQMLQLLSRSQTRGIK
jgi:hypothetical protein